MTDRGVSTGAAKYDAVAARTELEPAAGAGLHNLQRHGPVHLRVARGFGCQHIVAADVRDQETAPNEAESIGSRHQAMITELECRLRQKVSLVFLLDRCRIPRGIHQDSEGVRAVGKMHPGGVAK